MFRLADQPPILLRLRRRKCNLCAIALTIGFAATLTGCGSSTPPTSPVHGHELISIFESGPQLRANPVGTVERLKRLGVDVIKVFVPWNEIAPAPNSAVAPHFDATNPSAYPAAGWLPWDAIVRDAAARGVGVDLTLSKPPLWAAGPNPPKPGVHPQWKTSPRDFEAFMRAVGTRYSGHYTPPGATGPLPRVHFWSIWNEPNFGPDLAPQAIDNNRVEVSPWAYRRLADAAWTALGATGHGHDTILIGETAPRGTMLANSPGNFGGMVPLRFIRALYCVDDALHPLTGTQAELRHCPTTTTASKRFPLAHPVLFQATGFADHPYGQGSIPPNQVTPNEPDYADLAALPKLVSTLDGIMDAYGSSRRLPIYSTEFGYQTNPPELGAISTDPQTAAYYLNWSEYISWRNPRVVSYDQYLLVDPLQASGFKGFATGLEFKTGVPKASYFAYRMPLYLPVRTFKHGQALQVWGCVRPARFARLATGSVQHVEIQFRASSVSRFKLVRTIALNGRYFDTNVKFDSSGTVRLAWSYPDGQTIHSRNVDITLR